MTMAPKKQQLRSLAAKPDNASAAAGHEGQSARLADAAPPAQAGMKAKGVKAPKRRKQRVPAAQPVAVPAPAGHEDRLARLAEAVQAVRAGKQVSPRTAKLLAGGVPKMAQKLMEEAAETAIDAVREERTGFVNESADLLYNLVVLWSALGVAPGEVWTEMDRREALLGMAEKLPKADDAAG